MRTATIAIAILCGIGGQMPIKLFPEGKLKPTKRCLDLAIDGAGFFAVKADDQVLYTRRGDFRLDVNGRIVTREGYAVVPSITVPTDTVAIAITEDGVVHIDYGNPSSLQDVGQFTFVRFINPMGLRRVGNDYYISTDDAGPPLESCSMAQGVGRLRQGFLERLRKVKLDSD